jgi:Nif-specific regulatory protein
VRVISGTNRDLARAVQQQRFREDLYYRLRVFPIRIPPLRERREDIPLLAAHFVALRNTKLGKHVRGVAPEALELLQRYPWPGNIRELENEIERAIALAPDGELITPQHLSERVARAEAIHVDVPVDGRSFRAARLAFEREYLGEALRRNQGNASRTAKMLGLSRQKLQKKIKDYGLRTP